MKNTLRNRRKAYSKSLGAAKFLLCYHWRKIILRLVSRVKPSFRNAGEA